MLQANTSLHEAVVAGDLRQVLKYRSDEILMQVRDSYGFLAKELALLLGNLEIIEVLNGPLRPLLFEKKGSLVPLNAKKIADFFGIRFVPTLFFECFDLLKDVMKECPWIVKKSVYGRENRLWGMRLSKKIFTGVSANVYVKHIDSSIGYGLFAVDEIQQGDYVATYAGHVRRISRLHRDHNDYCLHYPTRWFSFRYHVVDALEYGNATRFINHSEEPNLQPKCAVDRNLLHTVFFALRDIKAGEELCFNYGKDFWR